MENQQVNRPAGELPQILQYPHLVHYYSKWGRSRHHLVPLSELRILALLKRNLKFAPIFKEAHVPQEQVGRVIISAHPAECDDGHR
jgi:hypothetical protein